MSLVLPRTSTTHHHHLTSPSSLLLLSTCASTVKIHHQLRPSSTSITLACRQQQRLFPISATSAGVPLPPLDLTEHNVKQVLLDARTEFGQIFDTSVGMTGQVELAELDGPFVKISLKGRFWHERSLVLARVGNYLKQRIPEILEVDIEDEQQLDDSPENF